MKKAIVVLLSLFCLSALGQSSQAKLPRDAWLQDGVKWSKAPADVNKKLRFGEAAILYFAADHTFALIYATVNRVPNDYQVISNGDGQVVYVGTWQAHDGKIAVKYRLVNRTVRKQGEILPGTVMEATIKSAGGVLAFDRKSFHRASPLDESALTVVDAAKKAAGAGAGHAGCRTRLGWRVALDKSEGVVKCIVVLSRF